ATARFARPTRRAKRQRRLPGAEPFSGEVSWRPPSDRQLLRQSGLMLAVWITFPHFSLSAAMNLPKSAADPGRSLPPCSARLAFIVGSASAALISLLSLSTISAGVALGAPTPNQMLAS